MTYYVVTQRTKANLYVLTGKDSYNVLSESKTKLPDSVYYIISLRNGWRKGEIEDLPFYFKLIYTVFFIFIKLHITVTMFF